MSAPRIKLYRSEDDGTYAAAFVGSNGKQLPVVIWSAGHTADEANEKAAAWWSDEQTRLKGKKPEPPKVEAHKMPWEV